MPSYRYCIVPMCTNTTVTAPEKLFFSVPREEKMRQKWCATMRRDEKKNVKLSPTSPLYCCEDHFNLEDDMMNYWQYKLAGSVRRLQLKTGVIPSVFDCQKQPICERQTGIDVTPETKYKRLRKVIAPSRNIPETSHELPRKHTSNADRLGPIQQFNSDIPETIVTSKSDSMLTDFEIKDEPITWDDFENEPSWNSHEIKEEPTTADSCQSSDYFQSDQSCNNLEIKEEPLTSDSFQNDTLFSDYYEIKDEPISKNYESD